MKINFKKFGFEPVEGPDVVLWQRKDLHIQYWINADCYCIIIPPDQLPEDLLRGYAYAYGFPVYVGKIIDATFFEILLASVLTDISLIRKMGT